MSKCLKDQAFFCKFSRVGRHKLKIISQKPGLSQADLLEKLVEKEYQKLKDTAWEGVYVQLNIFNDQPVDEAASLFDSFPDKVSCSA